MEKTKKRIISKTDYYKLIGLRHLSTFKNQELESLKSAVVEITGEKLDDSDYGHASDFVYQDDISVKELLRKLNIKVK